MEKTIDDRANDIVNEMCVDLYSADVQVEMCIKMAVEQREIDIEKACTYWHRRLGEIVEHLRNGGDISKTRELIDFRKAMSE